MLNILLQLVKLQFNNLIIGSQISEEETSDKTIANLISV